MNKQRQHRRVWTTQQDQTLKMYVEQSIDIIKPKWKQISQLLNTTLNLQFKRNPKQCRQRWYNSLAPTSQQTKQWSIQDDVILIQACKKYGHRWSRLTKQFDQNMNDNRLKNHFYSTVRKIVRIINNIVKQSKKQYQQNIKNNTLQIYSQQQLNIMKQISKLRTFQPKLLSKVFSLIDQKQQYRYQAKQNLQVQQIKLINNQILDYMQDYITNNNQFTNKRILKMIAKVMYVNRTIKTKYIRQVKLSIQDQFQIQKQQENRKKRQKKINNIVKQQLDNKIIPDRKTKIQIINKIRDQNKKLKKLIKPMEKQKQKRRIKRKKIISISPSPQQVCTTYQENRQNQIQKQQQQQLQQQQQQQNLDNFQDQINNNNPTTNKRSFRLKKQQQKLNNFNTTNNNNNNININNNNINDIQQSNPLGISIGMGFNLNMNFSFDLDPNFNRNLINNQNNRQKISYSPGSINFSNIFNFNQNNNYNNSINNISFTYQKQKIQQKNKMEQQQQKIPNQKQFSPSNFLIDDKNNNNNNQFNNNNIGNNNIGNDSKQEINNRDYPFSSNFLNNIPLASSNSKKQKNNQGFQFKQLINPFFPEHKLTHSQGYFTFQQPNNQRVQQADQELFKSNPIINSLNLIEAPNQQPSQQNIQMGSSKALRNSKIFQGLFASYNYSNSNNDKVSQKSQRMKSSLIDLIPNFHPMHTSAFNPILLGNLKQQQNYGGGQNKRLMQASRPFSVQFDQNFANRKFNMDQSQPIQLFRSHDERNQLNPQGPALSFSCSYGQKSQRSKSNRSRKNK